MQMEHWLIIDVLLETGFDVDVIVIVIVIRKFASCLWHILPQPVLYCRLFAVVPPWHRLSSYLYLATCEMWCWSGEMGILRKSSLCYISVYYYIGAQRYEQFLQVGQLYGADLHNFKNQLSSDHAVCVCMKSVVIVDKPRRSSMILRTCCWDPQLSSVSRNSWNCCGDLRLSTESNFSFALNDVCSALMSSLSVALTTWSE